MKKLFFLLVFPFIFCSEKTYDINKVKNEIRTVMDTQAASWNAGSIEGFMAGYWNSEEFTFQSGNNRVYGWNTLLERYKKNYSGANQGKLEFADLEIKILEKDLAYVLGRWKVTEVASPGEGLFTLLFKHLPEGWKIIHDHTSSESPK
jgi:beta-aspartyl-peptidase (threonine type)